MYRITFRAPTKRRMLAEMYADYSRLSGCETQPAAKVKRLPKQRIATIYAVWKLWLDDNPITRWNTVDRHLEIQIEIHDAELKQSR